MVIEWGMVPAGMGGGGAGGTEPFDPPPHAATANATAAIDPNLTLKRFLLSSSVIGRAPLCPSRWHYDPGDEDERGKRDVGDGKHPRGRVVKEYPVDPALDEPMSGLLAAQVVLPSRQREGDPGQ